MRAFLFREEREYSGNVENLEITLNTFNHSVCFAIKQDDRILRYNICYDVALLLGTVLRSVSDYKEERR